MVLVYTAPLLVTVAHARNLLENAGIACTVRNEFAGSAAGRLPFNECWPELWVEETEAARAQALLAEAFSATSAAGAGWRCAACGEQVEGQFGQCWRCGAMRPGA